MSDVILVLDRDGRYLEIATTSPELLYRPAAETLGKTLHELFAPEQADAFLEAVRRALDTRSTVEIEYMLQIGDTDMWFATSISPMFEDSVVWVARDITERKQAEEEMRESEELFRTSFENAIIGVALVGTDGRFLRVNRTLCELLGYTEEELQQMTFNDVTHSEDKDIGASFLASALSGGANSTSFEKRYIHKDGHLVWVHMSTALVRNATGEPRYFVTHIRDITERKWAEAALREAEAKYRTLVEAIPAITYIDVVEGAETDAVVPTAYISPQVQRILGYSPDEWMADPELWMSRLHPDDRERVLEAQRGLCRAVSA
jgi:PAS domain S-box-containing protein